MAALPVPDSFDAAAIADLRAIFSEVEFERLLSVFMAELDVRPRLIADLISRGEVETARAEAHRFKGGAMYFGRLPVIDLAERIEVEPDRALPALASLLVEAARALIPAEYPYHNQDRYR
ncbi:Hpt domain-containing protein [uncultured Sphingomonas sp.]|uniref:Hpt domain-containing protein n=1 Tax=uncultured Sphingomonas sp. TaxID=158754 RepID=UPI0035C9A5F5